MEMVFKTSNPVELSYICAGLDGADIAYYVADEHTSALYSGALIVRRVLVADEDKSRAVECIRNHQERPPEIKTET